MLKQITALLSCAFLCTQAHAYTLQTVFKTDHFAVNQVVLDEFEELDGELEYLIIRDVQTKHRIEKKYQSTTVVFPFGSDGLTGKINTPVNGILTVANYGSGEDKIVFNKKKSTSSYAGLYVSYDFLVQMVDNRALNSLIPEILKMPLVINKIVFNKKKSTSSYAGLYVSYDFLVQMVDNRALNSLIPEILKMPLVITDIPVSLFSVDFRNNKMITSKSKAVILDINIMDSVYYKAKEMAKLKDKCKVTVLSFTDRALPDVPLYIASHGALNNMTCPGDKSVKEQSSTDFNVSEAK